MVQLQKPEILLCYQLQEYCTKYQIWECIILWLDCYLDYSTYYNVQQVLCFRFQPWNCNHTMYGMEKHKSGWQRATEHWKSGPERLWSLLLRRYSKSACIHVQPTLWNVLTEAGWTRQYPQVPYNPYNSLILGGRGEEKKEQQPNNNNKKTQIYISSLRAIPKNRRNSPYGDGEGIQNRNKKAQKTRNSIEECIGMRNSV